MHRLTAILLALSLTQGGLSAADNQSPYVEYTERPIKALSAEEIDGLRAGRGMGFALAAELNGYPGPLHALEVADAIHLSESQRERTQTLYREMLDESRNLGERIVVLEAELDSAFATRTLTDERLRELTARIAELNGRVRYTHLRHHLEMTALLNPHQIELYNQVRGYGTRDGHARDHHHGDH
ncbi:Spy/CpxP family protein refolding chaperone [Thioalkalivibrio thiocyanodenitrificans]|uniref:Spy/CpxP family protein refolding chaperone n=1 Tax=Thioalkalivibrio thiocyanodenitrificans TaxID=243063 RepID=UPI0003681228|nr:hypothetical protein [Thioalkalivibrio thiocyanodenitrificans]